MQALGFLLLYYGLFGGFSMENKATKILSILKPKKQNSIKVQRLTKKNSIRTKPVAQIALINFHNYYYTGVISLGSPPQNFRVQFDTGVADFWVYSETCAWNAQLCRSRNRYDRKKSSSYIENGTQFSLDYGRGLSSGILSQDTLTIGGLSIRKQVFGEAEIIKLFDFYEPNVDGVFGLGLPALSRFSALTPFINAVFQGQIAPVFSFYFDRNASSEKGSQFFFGGVNPDYYEGVFLEAPLVSETYWTIQADQLKIGESLICESSCKLVFESGLSWITVPAKDYAKIHSILNITVSGAVEEFPCSEIGRLPTIRLSFSNFTLEIRPSDYVIKSPFNWVTSEIGTDVCFTGFMSYPFEFEHTRWILGSNFMGAYYTKFDAANKVVGFAKLAKK